MGYSTDFHGELVISPPLSDEQVAYINQFSETRRMKRDAAIAGTMPDPIREAVGLPIGDDAAYFTGGDGFAGQDKDASIVSYNGPPSAQPGLWCQWEVDSTSLKWNGAEKFYHYEEWLEYLIEHFFTPWGVKLNGQISWQGEDSDDRGTIHVKDSAVQAIADSITHPEPEWN